MVIMDGDCWQVLNVSGAFSNTYTHIKHIQTTLSIKLKIDICQLISKKISNSDTSLAIIQWHDISKTGYKTSEINVASNANNHTMKHTLLID